MQEVLENTQLDETRILTEAAIFADKVAVDEETVRLRSHLDQLREMLAAGRSPSGRKLDFLIQEFNREANTIGSKCSDVGHLPRGRGPEGRDRKDPRAGPEHRVTERRRAIELINIGFGNMVSASRLHRHRKP